MCSHIAAQVAAGGGGKPQPDQYFAPLPEYSETIDQLTREPGNQNLHRQIYAKWRAEIRRQLFIPAHAPKRSARVLVRPESPCPSHRSRVTYGTEYGMRVPAIVYRPDPKVHPWQGKLPGIVIVNGHGGDKFSWYAFYSGMLFARAGAVVITYDPIGEGERECSPRKQG